MNWANMAHGVRSMPEYKAENADLPEGFKMTEIGPLPEEWEVVPFDEAIAHTLRVPKIKRSPHQSIGSVPVVDQGQSLIAGYVDDIKPYEGELPVILFGDHTRVFRFVDFPFVAGADGTPLLSQIWIG